jgi:hypothetical protein
MCIYLFTYLFIYLLIYLFIYLFTYLFIYLFKLKPPIPNTAGKTLAYLLPLLSRVNPDEQHVQLLVLAPSRELAAQIASVATEVNKYIFVCIYIYEGRRVSVYIHTHM